MNKENQEQQFLLRNRKVSPRRNPQTNSICLPPSYINISMFWGHTEDLSWEWWRKQAPAVPQPHSRKQHLAANDLSDGEGGGKSTPHWVSVLNGIIPSRYLEHCLEQSNFSVKVRCYPWFFTTQGKTAQGSETGAVDTDCLGLNILSDSGQFT